MKTIEISSVAELNSFLKENRFWGNGKNFRIDTLHATCASSPRDYENLYGIYLTKPDHAWMGLWMGVTSRKNLKKRNLRYRRPDTKNGDHIGRLEIYSEKDDLKEYLCNTAFLYFFDPKKYADAETIDCSNLPPKEKIPFLKERGLKDASIEKNGIPNDTYLYPSDKKAIVTIDAWQIALVNFGTITPDIGIELGKNVIDALRARVTPTHIEVDDNYIKG